MLALGTHSTQQAIATVITTLFIAPNGKLASLQRCCTIAVSDRAGQPFGVLALAYLTSQTLCERSALRP
ncbi:hypothetical protein ACQ4M4_15745 [Leptolyngbya sp. AN02str]|uniref:hypothetical protein n=1 Tax=Leptolyngbya sp. AN02str TaxID=3423363 RepID=UPI003D311494